jgi:hypothetical protein
MTTGLQAPHARAGVEVKVAPGDVNGKCPACNTGAEAGHDGDPRHKVLGASSELQTATLSSGREIRVQVPVDAAYHFDCHAALGCDQCAEMLAAHDGTVKGKAEHGVGLPSVPDHLVDLVPGEFTSGGGGIQVRVADKAAASAAYEAAMASAGYEVVPAAAARELHAAHAAKGA